MTNRILAALAVLPIALSGASVAVARAEEPKPAIASDVIAKVGDQAITFNQINTMLNSSAVVGISIPAIGTPERDTARIVVLDKVISANLLYLDALKQGRNEDPTYQRELRDFSNGILAGLYRQRYLIGEVPVSEEEIQAFYKEVLTPDTELTDELRTEIEATLRKRKAQERLAAQRDKLREGIEIVVHEQAIAPAGDAERTDDEPVAEVGEEVITWGDVKATLMAAGKGAVALDPLAMEDEARRNALQIEIDTRVLAQKARAAGLDKDPIYRSRLAEYQKTRLINLHRAQLAKEIEPTEAQLKAYYEANLDQIRLVEKRKIQEVMLKTKEEAEATKAKLEKGELTMFQAAAEYSIAPGAKQNLGEVGWVAQGRAQPALDEMIFSLGPNEIGGPAESTEGWHLVKVLDVQDAKFTDFDDEATRKRTRRRYIHDRLNAYVVELRKNEFPVEVYEDRLVQLAQQEADMVKVLTEKAQEPGSVTEERVKELQKYLQPQ